MTRIARDRWLIGLGFLAAGSASYLVLHAAGEGSDQVWILIYVMLVMSCALTWRQFSWRHEHRRQIADLEFRTTHDPLTCLGNRTMLEREALRLSAPTMSTHGVVVLAIDLDDFKMINTRYGHDGGDQLLHIVGQRIQSCVRPGDVAIRTGGDEFAIILPDRSLDFGRMIAERVLSTFHEPVTITVAGMVAEVRVCASIGIALGQCVQLGDVLRRADETLMHIKSEPAKDHYETD